MRNSIGRAVVRKAAAAVAVAGVVGMAVAAPPTPNSGGTNVKSAVATMSASYEVKKEWEIEVIPNNVKDLSLLDIEVKDTDVGGTTTKNGNLGLVRVKTNSSSWDVTFTTANGGRLAYGNKEMGKAPQFDLSCMCVKEVDTGYVYGSKEYLRYSGGNDTCRLDVAIGMLDKVNGTTYILKGIATQNVTSPYNAAKVHTDSLAASRTTDASGGPVTGKAVSFARALVDSISTSVKSEIKVGGVKLNDAVTGSGFGPTATALEGPGGTVIPHDGWEYFFVNVGLPSKGGTPPKPIAGNIDGKYEETFTFTLVADF